MSYPSPPSTLISPGAALFRTTGYTVRLVHRPIAGVSSRAISTLTMLAILSTSRRFLVCSCYFLFRLHDTKPLRNTDLISTISDPEHPLTLGQLAVVNLADIHVDPPPTPGRGPNPDTLTTVTVELTPTVNHCSLATIIGLAVRVRLDTCLPPNYRLDIKAKEGYHDQDDQITKQLADKERVAAALENDTLRQSLETMMATCVSPYSSGEEVD